MESFLFVLSIVDRICCKLYFVVVNVQKTVYKADIKCVCLLVQYYYRRKPGTWSLLGLYRESSLELSIINKISLV